MRANTRLRGLQKRLQAPEDRPGGAGQLESYRRCRCPRMALAISMNVPGIAPGMLRGIPGTKRIDRRNSDVWLAY